MTPNEFFLWLQDTPLGVAIRESGFLFPWIESVHVLAITIVLGTILIVDLRLMGVASRAFPVSKVMHDTLPFTVANFVLAVITGTALFTSNSAKYAENFPFQMKMVLMLLAFVNLTAFHFITMRDIAKWDAQEKAPAAVGFAGLSSIVLWLGVVAFGRWIGFTMGV